MSGECRLSTRRNGYNLIGDDRPTSIDHAFVDFDGVRYHLHTPEKKTDIMLSMDWRCWPDLVILDSTEPKSPLIALWQVKCGVEDIMTRIYGQYLTATESDYSVSLLLPVEEIPQDAGSSFTLLSITLLVLKSRKIYIAARTALITSLSLIKRNALSAPFERAFDIQKQLESMPSESGEKCSITNNDNQL